MPKQHGGHNIIDITGERFGRLVALHKSSVTCKQGALWKCLCDCGQTVTAKGPALRNGSKKSCGCLAQETLKAYRDKHSKWLGEQVAMRSPDPLTKQVVISITANEHANLLEMAGQMGEGIGPMARLLFRKGWKIAAAEGGVSDATARPRVL